MKILLIIAVFIALFSAALMLGLYIAAARYDSESFLYRLLERWADGSDRFDRELHEKIRQQQMDWIDEDKLREAEYRERTAFLREKPERMTGAEAQARNEQRNSIREPSHMGRRNSKEEPPRTGRKK